MNQRERGFTIVEVLIAIVILSVGVLALSSSSGAVTRMIYGGKAKTQAAAVGQSILDSLRTAAQTATPVCSGLFGSTWTRGGITALWAVATQTSPVGNGSARFIELRLTYRIGTQRGGDTLRTTIYCP